MNDRLHYQLLQSEVFCDYKTLDWDLFLIPGCMTPNVSTLLSRELVPSSLLNWVSPVSIKPPPPPLLKCVVWNRYRRNKLKINRIKINQLPSSMLFKVEGLNFSLKIFIQFFVFLFPLFGDAKRCFAFSCPAIGNKKHDVKKQQQQNNLWLELHFFHMPMVMYTTVGWSGNHGEWWSFQKGILMTQNISTIIMISKYQYYNNDRK